MASLLWSFSPNTTAMGLPAHAPRRPAADAVVVRCSLPGAVGGGGARSADDYQATLRALNSKGVRRSPRKSLGQDPRMAALVRDRFQGFDQVMVLEEDFMKCHFHSYMSHLLESKKSMGTDTRYAKDETALRLVDSSLRTSEYRLINIFVNFYSDAEYQFKVERTNFFPQPNVDAAVVTFKLKRTAEYPEVGTIKGFFSMMNSAFNAKRKMLRKSLQHFCTSLEIEAALKNAGLPVTSRPEELSLDDFVRLHNLLTRR